MKKAILNGKGNKNHEVHGLDGFGALYDHRTGRMHRPMSTKPGMRHINPMHAHHPVNRLHKHMPLRTVIGNEMFQSENPVGALGELGEPITAATIAAASGVIAAIASTLKKIGDIFGGKGKGSEDFDEAANSDAEKEIPEGGKSDEDAKAAASIESGGSSSSGGDESSGGGSPKSSGGGGGSSSSGGSSGEESSSGGGESSGGGGGASTEVAPAGGGGGGDDVNGGAETPTKALAKSSGGGSDDSGGGDSGGGGGFIEKNKKWLMPVGIGVGVLTIGALIAKSMKPPTPAPSSSRKPMHGIPHRKTSHKRKPKPKPKAKTKRKHTGGKTRGKRKGKLSAMTV